jgi:hypothetical protein
VSSVVRRARRAPVSRGLAPAPNLLTVTAKRQWIAFVIAAVFGFVFGAADQYLGSRGVTLGIWASTVSMLSAPWLVLPFAFGCSQTRPRRAAALGLVATMAGLAGYFTMMWSPIEGVPWSQFATQWHYLVGSQRMNIAGGLATGPFFGYLGQRWRAHRSWASATLVAGALCLEPLVRWAVDGRLSTPAFVYQIEVAAGIALALFFIVSGVSRRRETA